MAQHDIAKLDSGAEFPSLSFDLAQGGSFSFPTNKWTVLQLYRGHW